MSRPTTILGKCLGLNTKDRPSELKLDDAEYLWKAVNVDITDQTSVARRKGVTSVFSGLSAAHSMRGWLDKWVFFADGANLYSHDVTSGATSMIDSELTPGIPICYTPIGQDLAYSNGVERGIIRLAHCYEYYPFIEDPTQLRREIVEFPVTDIICFYRGSMYGANKKLKAVYCSEPYKPAHYDQVGGYMMTPGGVSWIKGVDGGLIVGHDSGIVAFAGSGLGNFQEREISSSPSILASEPITLDFERRGQTRGILALTSGGIIFITGSLEVIPMTTAVPTEWGALEAGAFVKIDNSYIFSGATS